jgi:RHS repeat-associated protein
MDVTAGAAHPAHARAGARSAPSTRRGGKEERRRAERAEHRPWVGRPNSFRVVTETVNGAFAATFTYDDDDLLLQAGALTIARDPESGRVTGTMAGSVSDAWSYNEYGEPSAYAATVSGSPLLAFAYERDDLGRIRRKTETRGGVARVFEYGYDLAGRLETVTEDGTLAESYAYDPNGNRTSTMNSAGVVTATYDAQDRIETSGSLVFGFSDAGELKSKLDTSTGDLTTYDHDALGNLRGVVLPDGTEIEYLVDGRGRRVAKIVDGAIEHAWLWRGQLQPVAELDGSGNVLARYVYADGMNVPELMVTATGTYRLVKDHLGSVREVVDVATGAVGQELVYDSWGRVLVDTNPGFQPFGFAGGLYDVDTGLVRFGARDYEAETGRWTAKDPRRFADTGNLYQSARSCPSWLQDVDGHDAIAAGVNVLLGPLVDALGLGAGAAATEVPAAGALVSPAGAAAVAFIATFLVCESETASAACDERGECGPTAGPTKACSLTGDGFPHPDGGMICRCSCSDATTCENYVADNDCSAGATCSCMQN